MNVFGGITIRKGLRFLRDFGMKRSPEIAAGGALLFGGLALFECYKATKKLDDAIAAAEIEKNKKVLADKMQGKSMDEPIENLTTKEKIPVIAKTYWKTAVFAGLSAGLLIASVRLGRHQLKAAVLMASVAQNALDEHEKATEQVVGEKKAAEIKGKAAQNAVAKNPPKLDGIIDTGSGTTLCYDRLSGRYFWSDIEVIRRAVNNLNADLLDMGFVSLNDYYDALELPNVKYGSSSGWHYTCDHSWGKQIKLSYEYGFAIPGEEPVADSLQNPPAGSKPVMIIDIRTEPKFDYHDDLC